MASSSTEQLSKLEKTDPASVKSPLGEGKYIQTAGCIIIGDEVLNGKTKDTNSNFFAQYCFDLGIELKRIEVIADDEEEIVEAARRMTDKYDFVVTSGGIGPTHDDITYPSLATAFSLPLEYHEETGRRMWALASPERKEQLSKATPAQKEARDRMALFPTAKGGHGSDGSGGSKSEVIFVEEDKWVPVVRLGGKLCIFPGIPSLFQQLLLGLTPYLPLPPASSKPFRHLIYTKQPESVIAPFLTELQARVKKEGIRVGSYPYLYSGVHVSLIGHDVERVKELGQEVVKELDGQVISQGRLGEGGSDEKSGST
ncbi:MoaB/Mog domain-containing protein [Kockovaella imperatae]|uniref:MoaB/Mog domain-containing protein n=1 Tax=Kockovaella imperatae TaxID=4999 RepID=A0A1Y1UK83_9TREE|nr:MoaB/Mog domain-containing protein [Kockovaella imperatae]ORX37876.1 MoaB/Mog domain-containing protein [Kockovaella imperatae]